jgi:hypothetical protein
MYRSLHISGAAEVAEVATIRLLVDPAAAGDLLKLLLLSAQEM